MINRVFRWILKKNEQFIIDYIHKILIKLMQKKEIQELIAEVLDAQIDRQVARIQGQVGGQLKGIGALGSVLGLNRENVMGSILQLIASRPQNKNSSEPNVLLRRRE